MYTSARVCCAVLCLLSAVALTNAEDEFPMFAEVKTESLKEFAHANDKIGQLNSATETLLAASTQLRKTAQTTKLSAAIIPNTWHVCEDLNYLYTKANDAHTKLQEAEGHIKQACKTIKKTVDTCDKIGKIKTATTTADLVLTPLKSLPYIGPVLKVVSPVVKNVKVQTTTAQKCKNYIDRLELRKLKDNCPKVMKRMKETDIRLSLIFNDIEIAQQLWCTCTTDKTEKSDPVDKGCERATKYRKFGKCSKEWTCPLRTNAKEIAIRCPRHARPRIEKLSGLVYQDLRKLKVCIDTTFSALIKLDKLFHWLKKLDWSITVASVVLTFWNLLAPLDNFLAMIRNALDRDITITMPGCPSASAKNELTKLTEEELNERVIKATGMNLKEATKPLTGKEYINHPEVLKFRKQFAEQLKYTPIEEWYGHHVHVCAQVLGLILRAARAS